MYDCFGLCNVVTAFKSPVEKTFCEDFKVVFRFKGGYILADIFTLEIIES